MTDWYVGQKVVCVNGHFEVWYSDVARKRTKRPVAGTVYTIRHIFEIPYGVIDLSGAPRGGEITFRLEEIVNPEFLWPGGFKFEQGFLHSRFRPVVSKQTDLSEFHSILDRVNRREVVDA